MTGKSKGKWVLRHAAIDTSVMTLYAEILIWDWEWEDNTDRYLLEFKRPRIPSIMRHHMVRKPSADPRMMNGVLTLNRTCHHPKGQLAGSKELRKPWTTLVAV